MGDCSGPSLDLKTDRTYPADPSLDSRQSILSELPHRQQFPQRSSVGTTFAYGDAFDEQVDSAEIASILRQYSSALAAAGSNDPLQQRSASRAASSCSPSASASQGPVSVPVSACSTPRQTRTSRPSSATPASTPRLRYGGGGPSERPNSSSSNVARTHRPPSAPGTPRGGHHGNGTTPSPVASRPASVGVRDGNGLGSVSPSPPISSPSPGSDAQGASVRVPFVAKVAKARLGVATSEAQYTQFETELAQSREAALQREALRAKERAEAFAAEQASWRPVPTKPIRPASSADRPSPSNASQTAPTDSRCVPDAVSSRCVPDAVSSSSASAAPASAIPPDVVVSGAGRSINNVSDSSTKTTSTPQPASKKGSRPTSASTKASSASRVVHTPASSRNVPSCSQQQRPTSLSSRPQSTNSDSRSSIPTAASFAKPGSKGTARPSKPDILSASQSVGLEDSSQDDPVTKAERARDTGNRFYKNQDYKAAVGAYTACLTYCPGVAVYWSNRAAAYYMLQNYQEALSDCSKSLSIDPGSTRALCRRAKCHEALDNPRLALRDWEKVVSLCDDAEAAVAVENIRAQLYSKPTFDASGEKCRPTYNGDPHSFCASEPTRPTFDGNPHSYGGTPRESFKPFGGIPHASSSSYFKKRFESGLSGFSSEVPEEPSTRLAGISLRGTYYEALDLPVSFTKQELRKAYHAQCLQCHPDRFSSADPREKEAAEKKFKELGIAYEVLGDKEKKSVYDTELLLTRRSVPLASSSNFYPAFPSNPVRPPSGSPQRPPSRSSVFAARSSVFGRAGAHNTAEKCVSACFRSSLVDFLFDLVAATFHPWSFTAAYVTLL